MNPLVAHCPKTAAVINTGIGTEFKSLSQVWRKTIRIRCPHCNEEHEIKVSEAYLGRDFGFQVARRLKLHVQDKQNPAEAGLCQCKSEATFLGVVARQSRERGSNFSRRYVLVNGRYRG
jgi:hypothetical protein